MKEFPTQDAPTTASPPPPTVDDLVQVAARQSQDLLSLYESGEWKAVKQVDDRVRCSIWDLPAQDRCYIKLTFDTVVDISQVKFYVENQPSKFLYVSELDSYDVIWRIDEATFVSCVVLRSGFFDVLVVSMKLLERCEFIGGKLVCAFSTLSSKYATLLPANASQTGVLLQTEYSLHGWVVVPLPSGTSVSYLFTAEKVKKKKGLAQHLERKMQRKWMTATLWGMMKKFRILCEAGLLSKEQITAIDDEVAAARKAILHDFLPSTEELSLLCLSGAAGAKDLWKFLQSLGEDEPYTPSDSSEEEPDTQATRKRIFLKSLREQLQYLDL